VRDTTTSAVLKPADTHLVAKIDQLVNEANPKAEAIRTAAEITLEIWGHVYTSEDAAERLKTGTKLLKFALNHGAFLPETRAHSRGLRRAEYSSGIQGVMVVLFF
jgi:hypothetical protein